MSIGNLSKAACRDAFLALNEGNSNEHAFAHFLTLLDQHKPFADTQFDNRISQAIQNTDGNGRTKLIQCWWEMYVSYILRLHGVNLVQRERWGSQVVDEGPDLLAVIGERRAWIECVVSESGNGENALQIDEQIGRVRVSKQNIQKRNLRLLNSIGYKHNKLEKYVVNGIVNSNDYCIIAISGACLPKMWVDKCVDPPWIYRALYGQGFERVLFASPGGKHQQFIESQPVIIKHNGSEIISNKFLNGDFSIISCILYSEANPWNYPQGAGCDMIMIRNATANHECPVSWIPDMISY